MTRIRLPARVVLMPILAASWLFAAASRAASGEAGRPLDVEDSNPEMLSAPESSSPVSLLRRVISGRTLAILCVGGAATWLSREEDDDIELVARALDGESLLVDGGVDAGNVCGSGITLGAVTAGLLLSGQVEDRPSLVDAGSDLARSLLLGGAVVWTLKLALNRRRPGGGRYSFPSGHAAAAFGTGPILQHYFGWKVGIPAYSMAVLTAAGRLEDRRHYLSDVVFGAAVGFAMGDAVIRRDESGLPRETVAVDSRGISIVRSF